MGNTSNLEFDMYLGGLNYPSARRNEGPIRTLVTESPGLKTFIFFMVAKVLLRRTKYIGKIQMRLTPSSALAAVKRRAVNSSTK
jgi:hypothetical protein